MSDTNLWKVELENQLNSFEGDIGMVEYCKVAKAFPGDHYYSTSFEHKVIDQSLFLPWLKKKGFKPEVIENEEKPNEVWIKLVRI